jgi:hypothetical protein
MAAGNTIPPGEVKRCARKAEKCQRGTLRQRCDRKRRSASKGDQLSNGGSAEERRPEFIVIYL